MCKADAFQNIIDGLIFHINGVASLAEANECMRTHTLEHKMFATSDMIYEVNGICSRIARIDFSDVRYICECSLMSLL